MDWADRQFAIMDDRTVRDMRVIDFVHGHLWMFVAYAMLFVTCLVWLEFRNAPRWAVWVTFILLSIPLLAYDRTTLHIGSKVIMW